MLANKIAPDRLAQWVALLGEKPLWVQNGWAAASGGLMALGQPPFNLVPLTLLGLVFAGVSFLSATTVRHVAWIGWWCGLGYFAVMLHWLVEPFFIYPRRDGWMAPVILVFMGGLAIFWAAAFAAAARLSSVTVLALTLTLAELLRSCVLTGFPWGLLGYIWLNTPISHLAAWIGPHGLTFFTTVLIFVPLGLALRHPYSIAVAVCLCTFLGAWLLGAVQAALPAPKEIAKIVRLIQPNAPQEQKWHPDYIEKFFLRQLDYSAAEPQPDLIVWPETAIATLLNQADAQLEDISVAARRASVVLGVQRHDHAGFYNTLVVLDSAGKITQRYDKHHLVPFGEYVPLADFFEVLSAGLVGQFLVGFQPGPGPTILNVPGIGKILPLICYEGIFPHEISSVPERPDLMLLITNDAWFGTFSGPYQHLAQARMRAIEQGVPMVRVANTGVSAVIDAKGRLQHQLPLGRSGYLDAHLPDAAAPTFYSRFGDWPVLGLLLLLSVLSTMFREKIC